MSIELRGKPPDVEPHLSHQVSVVWRWSTRLHQSIHFGGTNHCSTSYGSYLLFVVVRIAHSVEILALGHLEVFAFAVIRYIVAKKQHILGQYKTVLSQFYVLTVTPTFGETNRSTKGTILSILRPEQMSMVSDFARSNKLNERVKTKKRGTGLLNILAANTKHNIGYQTTGLGMVGAGSTPCLPFYNQRTNLSYSDVFTR